MKLHISRMAILLAFLLVASVPVLSVPPGQRCSRPAGVNSTCVCQTKNGLVDLRPASSHNGHAKYKDFEDPNDYVYEYNPCTAFTTIGDCSNVYLCQETKHIPPLTYKIADGGTEQMFYDRNDEKVTLYYTSVDQFEEKREAYVHLECEPSIRDAIVTTTGDSIEIYIYEVYFKSCHACPGGCGGTGGGGEPAAGVVEKYL